MKKTRKSAIREMWTKNKNVPLNQSELLGQFRLINDCASDVSGGRICLTQNAYAEI